MITISATVASQEYWTLKAALRPILDVDGMRQTAFDYRDGQLSLTMPPQDANTLRVSLLDLPKARGLQLANLILHKTTTETQNKPV